MPPLPRPPRLRARLSWRRKRWWAGGVVMSVMMGLLGPLPVQAAEAGRPVKRGGGLQQGASSASSASAATQARRAAQVEAANIAELRSRMSSRDLALLRRADMGDARIDVWLYQPTRQYYVSVSMQGALRRTLKPVNEAEAWLNFDSFRRIAALGEVGRPVLLGQLPPAGTAVGQPPSASLGAYPGASAGASAGASPGASPGAVPGAALGESTGAMPGPVAVAPTGASAESLGLAPTQRLSVAERPSTFAPGQDLKTVPVPRDRLAAPNDVDEMDLEQVRLAREAYVGASASAPAPSLTSSSIASSPSSRSLASGSGKPQPTLNPPATETQAVVGQSVETLRRERIGEEVARLVWSADSGQFTASITRQGRVVGMLRSPDRQAAQAAFDDMVRQAQARAVASAAK